jgi:FtsP/CotA-like multicopper oxidase with cupredoxin domain
MLADQMFSHADRAWASRRSADKARARYTLRIAPCKLEIAPGILIDTIGYNGRCPDRSCGFAKASPSWPRIDPLHVRQGRRYRMIFRNGSGDQHPMHLHRHTFEVTRACTKEFSGLRKNVINVMPLDSVAVDFVADNPGDTLLHCHQALHMDFGFMQLMKYVD